MLVLKARYRNIEEEKVFNKFYNWSHGSLEWRIEMMILK